MSLISQKHFNPAPTPDHVRIKNIHSWSCSGWKALTPVGVDSCTLAPAHLWLALSNLRLADSWLGAVHKNTYALSRSRRLPSADIFWTGVIQMRTSELFVAKTNIEFFLICSVSTSDMDRGRGEGLNHCLHFLDKGRSIFHDFVQTS